MVNKTISRISCILGILLVALPVDALPHSRQPSKHDSIPRKRHPSVHHRQYFLDNPTCYWKNPCNFDANPTCELGNDDAMRAGNKLHDDIKPLWIQKFRSLITLEKIMKRMSGRFCNRRFHSKWCEFNEDTRKELEAQYEEHKKLREEKRFLFFTSCEDAETLKHIYNDYKMDLARLYWLVREEDKDPSTQHLRGRVWELLTDYFAGSICNARSLLFNDKGFSKRIDNLDMEFMLEIIHDERQDPAYNGLTSHMFRYMQLLKVKDSWTASRHVLQKCAASNIFHLD